MFFGVESRNSWTTQQKQILTTRIFQKESFGAAESPSICLRCSGFVQDCITTWGTAGISWFRGSGHVKSKEALGSF